MTPPSQLKSGWLTIPSDGEIPSYSLFSSPLERPDLDTREYRLIRLDNGLLCMLIHDAEADKAAACVSIAVGALNDPVSSHIFAGMVSTSDAEYRTMYRVLRISASTCCPRYASC